MTIFHHKFSVDIQMLSSIITRFVYCWLVQRLLQWMQSTSSACWSVATWRVLKDCRIACTATKWCRSCHSLLPTSCSTCRLLKWYRPFFYLICYVLVFVVVQEVMFLSHFSMHNAHHHLHFNSHFLAWTWMADPPWFSFTTCSRREPLEIVQIFTDQMLFC